MTGAVDLTDPCTFVDGPPQAFLAELRHHSPVWRQPATERHPGFWVLTRYDDVHDTLLRPSELINAKGITIEPNEPTQLPAGSDEQGQHALSYSDPPEHQPLRRVLSPHFVPARIRDLSPVVEVHARRLVAEFVAAGGGDFVAAVAEPYPLVVLAAVLDLPPSVAEALRRFATGASGPVEFLGHIGELAEVRRREPGADLVSSMVVGTDEGGSMPADRLGGILIQLALAGNETTRAASGHAVRVLAERPDQWRSLVDAPEHVPAAVEEVLRFRPPVHYLRRTAAEATTIGTRGRAQPVEPDEIVYLSIASANRDEAVFGSGDAFDPTRVAHRSHLSFGVGVHFCLGAALARLELRCLLVELARSMPRFTLAGEPVPSPSPLFDALARLPLAVG